MAISLRAFHVELYEEHLDDAAFLYEQRRVLHVNPEIAWMDVADFEERLEAHVDALVVGGDLALDVCVRRAVEGEAGELFTAVCVFCRQLQAARFAEVVKAVDLDDVEKARAVCNGLKYELPESWRASCYRAAAQPESKLAGVLAVVLGYRRLQPSAELVSRLRSVAPAAVPTILWSLGRNRAELAIPVVREFLTSDDPPTAAAAVQSALRLHDMPTANRLMSDPHTAATHPIAIGLAAGRSKSKALLHALAKSDKPRDVVTACGLLGDVAIVRQLLDLLADEDVAAAAADALHVITGAPLFEDTIIPDAVDEDEMTEKELTAFRERGELPQRADGTPFGTRVRRLALDPSAWNAWLDSNTSRFQRAARYRLGALCSPQTLLDCLQSTTYPKPYRRWVCDELLIRYGIDLPFEVDMPVRQQRQVLDGAIGSIARATAATQEGQWYFAGEVVTS